MGHSVVRTESRQNHFHSSEISPKRGTTFSRQRQFTSNKINELIHVRQRKVLKMGQGRASRDAGRSPAHVWRVDRGASAVAALAAPDVPSILDASGSQRSPRAYAYES